MQHMANMLVNTRNKKSWEKYFPPGSGMLSALIGAGPFPGFYDWIYGWGDGGAERARYAEFLDEAAILLNKERLGDAAEIFRKSHKAWVDLAKIALPDEVAILKEARKLLSDRNQLFLSKGSDSLNEIVEINQRLDEMLAESKENFPLDESGVKSLRENISKSILEIHDIEERAIESLKEAMS
jgi:ElaB/YqjD/DUF883 family membrane-anchored ribosome-binding protein